MNSSAVFNLRGSFSVRGVSGCLNSDTLVEKWLKYLQNSGDTNQMLHFVTSDQGQHGMSISQTRMG